MSVKKKVDKPKSEKVDKRGGARPGAGRPAFVPTEAERKQVEALSGYGLPMEQIAMLVRNGIHIDTLRTHFQQQLGAGKAKANAQVGKTLFQRAIGGDTTAMIWWSKTQMKWSEVQRHELTGADGGPVQLAAQVVEIPAQVPDAVAWAAIAASSAVSADDAVDGE